MKIKAVYADENLRIGTVGSLIVTIVAGQPPENLFEVLEREYGALLEQHPKISVLSVLKFESASRVRNDSKEAAVALVQKYQHQLRAQATVVAMQGLSGSLIRTFMVGFNLLTRSSYPTKVFGTVSEAVGWLKKVPGQDIDLADSSETASDEIATFMQ